MRNLFLSILLTGSIVTSLVPVTYAKSQNSNKDSGKVEKEDSVDKSNGKNKNEVNIKVTDKSKSEVQIEVETNVKGEVKGDKTASSPGLLKKLLSNTAIGSGQVTNISGSTLTITKDGKTYTIETDAKTKFRRKFWGQSTISEISVNDIVNVMGKWVDDAHTQVAARFVRDLSIQKRFGVFFGKVTAISTTGFTVETVARGTLMVTTNGNTNFINRRQEGIPLSDIVVGHWIRVRGLWDSKNDTLTEVTHVKDFSLPRFPGPTKQPTSTPAL